MSEEEVGLVLEAGEPLGRQRRHQAVGSYADVGSLGVFSALMGLAREDMPETCLVARQLVLRAAKHLEVRTDQVGLFVDELLARGHGPGRAVVDAHERIR